MSVRLNASTPKDRVWMTWNLMTVAPFRNIETAMPSDCMTSHTALAHNRPDDRRAAGGCQGPAEDHRGCELAGSTRTEEAETSQALTCREGLSRTSALTTR